jgi:ABC-type multidrug transport system ATPase subunit
LIKSGQAYVCDLSADQIREYRGTLTEAGRESPYRNRSVAENLEFYAGVYGLPMKKRKSSKEWAMKMSGLVGRERTLVRALSGGWNSAWLQPVNPARARLFLDEPTRRGSISRRAFWDLDYDLAGAGAGCDHPLS